MVTGGDGAYGGNAGTKGDLKAVCHQVTHIKEKNQLGTNMSTIDTITPTCPECASAMSSEQEDTNGQNIIWHFCTDKGCGRILKELSP